MEADWCVCCVCVRAGRMRRHLDELMSCWDGEEEEEKKTVPFIFPCIYLPLEENKEKNTEYIYIYISEPFKPRGKKRSPAPD